MKNSNSETTLTITPSQLQKLVDGELDHLTRSSLIEALPVESACWREIAFAFVEKQVLDEALNQSDSDLNLACSSKPHSVVATKSGLVRVDQRRNRIQILIWIAGLAACLLLGVFVGVEFERDAKSSPSISHISPQSENADSTQATNRESFDLADALSRSSLPVPKEFRRALLKAGYALEEDQKITAVDLPTGGTIELPVRNINVTYVGLDSIQ